MTVTPYAIESSLSLLTHGVQWVSAQRPTTGASSNGALPDSRFPGATVFAFWQDLVIETFSDRFNYQDQHVSWTYTVDSEPREVRFNWLAHYPYSNPTHRINVELIFVEGGLYRPTLWFKDSDQDVTGAVVGSQDNFGTGVYHQFTRDPIGPLTRLSFDPDSGWQ